MRFVRIKSVRLMTSTVKTVHSVIKRVGMDTTTLYACSSDVLTTISDSTVKVNVICSLRLKRSKIVEAHNGRKRRMNREEHAIETKGQHVSRRCGKCLMFMLVGRCRLTLQHATPGQWACWEWISRYEKVDIVLLSVLDQYQESQDRCINTMRELLKLKEKL